MRGEHAEEQPRRCAGVAEVEQVFRLGEGANAYAVDRTPVIPAPDHTCAQRIQRGSGSEHVVTFEQTRNLRPPDRKRAEHQRTMRDRFVARNTHRAGERATTTRRGRCRLPGGDRMSHGGRSAS